MPKSTKKASEKIYLANGNKHLDPKTGEMVFWNASPRTVVDVLGIAERIVKGESRMSILKSLREIGELNDKQAIARYDAAIRYLMPTQEEQEEMREKMMAKVLARYERLYEKAMDRDSINQAREILDSISKLYGLTGGNRVQIAESADGDKVINISFD